MRVETVRGAMVVDGPELMAALSEPALKNQ